MKLYHKISRATAQCNESGGAVWRRERRSGELSARAGAMAESDRHRANRRGRLAQRVAGGGPLPTGGRKSGREVSTGSISPGGRKYEISRAG